ncbi:MAG: class I SAM-dependent methyltransferase [Candidatus Lokiarchaeota archaeon]|nr:class I SAM-dependent methyltransferase [Candidatus Lokiarchaeota archaeon]
MKSYWNRRFELEEKIWGSKASQSAEKALELFNKDKIGSLLIPGAGYGRNSKLFSQAGYKVVGLEISDYACNIAKSFDLDTLFINASITNIPLLNERFNLIYCFNVLHLFLKNDRILFIENCYNLMKNNGFAFFTVFSEHESSFSKGKKIEENTYESKPGRPVHYFSEKDLIEHFESFSMIENGILNELENHGGNEHTHRLRYIFVKK